METISALLSPIKPKTENVFYAANNYKPTATGDQPHPEIGIQGVASSKRTARTQMPIFGLWTTPE